MATVDKNIVGSDWNEIDHGLTGKVMIVNTSSDYNVLKISLNKKDFIELKNGAHLYTESQKVYISQVNKIGKVKITSDFFFNLIGSGSGGSSGEPGPQGPKGDDGKSAYEIWLEQPGNEGKTVEEFLLSLIGPQGPKGDDGEVPYEEISNEIESQISDLNLAGLDSNNTFKKENIFEKNIKVTEDPKEPNNVVTLKYFNDNSIVESERPLGVENGKIKLSTSEDFGVDAEGNLSLNIKSNEDFVMLEKLALKTVGQIPNSFQEVTENNQLLVDYVNRQLKRNPMGGDIVITNDDYILIHNEIHNNWLDFISFINKIATTTSAGVIKLGTANGELQDKGSGKVGVIGWNSVLTNSGDQNLNGSLLFGNNRDKPLRFRRNGSCYLNWENSAGNATRAYVGFGSSNDNNFTFSLNYSAAVFLFDKVIRYSGNITPNDNNDLANKKYVDDMVQNNAYGGVTEVIKNPVLTNSDNPDKGSKKYEIPIEDDVSISILGVYISNTSNNSEDSIPFDTIIKDNKLIIYLGDEAVSRIVYSKSIVQSAVLKSKIVVFDSDVDPSTILTENGMIGFQRIS